MNQSSINPNAPRGSASRFLPTLGHLGQGPSRICSVLRYCSCRPWRWTSRYPCLRFPPPILPTILGILSRHHQSHCCESRCPTNLKVANAQATTRKKCITLHQVEYEAKCFRDSLVEPWSLRVTMAITWWEYNRGSSSHDEAPTTGLAYVVQDLELIKRRCPRNKRNLLIGTPFVSETSNIIAGARASHIFLLGGYFQLWEVFQYPKHVWAAPYLLV